MSDAPLPPPDPDEVERDPGDDAPHDEVETENPPIAGVGPALFTPPVPDRDESDEPEPGD